MLCNIEKEYVRAFNLFISNNFFRKTNASEILHYYSNELLSKLYPLLSNKEQKEINQAILSTKTLFYHWTYKDDYSEKKVYSNYLKTTYELVSMLPLTFLNEYKELKKIYQEGYRKYNKIENTPPQKVTMYSGWKTYGNNAYEKMSLNDWKNTFFKTEYKTTFF